MTDASYASASQQGSGVLREAKTHRLNDERPAEVAPTVVGLTNRLLATEVHAAYRSVRGASR